MSTKPDPNPVATAYGLLTSNLVVLPGLGTYTGGRRVAGVSQMVTSIVGFLLTIGGMAPLVPTVLGGGLVTFDSPFFQTALAGVSIFLIGWVGALFSGLSLVAEAKRRVRDGG